MNKMLQQEGEVVFFNGWGGQFHTMDWEGLAILHMVE